MAVLSPVALVSTEKTQRGVPSHRRRVPSRLEVTQRDRRVGHGQLVTERRPVPGPALDSSGWATGGAPGDFELLCLDGSRAAVADWRACNLGHVPPNIVVTRPVTLAKVYDFLVKSQEASVTSTFQLFQSQKYGESDLLFKDATQHLIPASHLDYKAILGTSFFQLAESVFSCTPAGILDFCKQDSCAYSAQQ